MAAAEPRALLPFPLPYRSQKSPTLPPACCWTGGDGQPLHPDGDREDPDCSRGPLAGESRERGHAQPTAPLCRQQPSHSDVPKGWQDIPAHAASRRGGRELLPSPCLFWVTASSERCTQQPATGPQLSKLSSAAARRRLLSLHVPVTGPASSRRRQMRSGSRMLWGNPPLACPRRRLIFSTARFESAASPREEMWWQGAGSSAERRIRPSSCPGWEDGNDLGITPSGFAGFAARDMHMLLVQPLSTLRQHQTKLHSPTVSPEKEFFWRITSPSSQPWLLWAQDFPWWHQQSLSPQAEVTSPPFKPLCKSFTFICDKTNKN
ncbi:uncharacterized protein ACIBXB_018193 [Morphnus guianensis]